MSLNPKTIEKRKHNRRTYQGYTFRVRRGSDLATQLEEYAQYGETSVNFLMTELLCKHFGCALPHREYTVYKRVRLV